MNMKPALLPALLLAVLLPGSMPGADAASDLRLIPFPKTVELKPGRCDLGAALVLEAPAGELPALAKSLNEELRRAGLPGLSDTRAGSEALVFRLGRAGATATPGAVPGGDSPERYRLEVSPEGIAGRAATPAGLFYGVQTLCQLIRANRQETALPCVSIGDYPSLRWRCFQDDMTRGPSSTLETLRYEAALAASLKLNLMTFYMEYQFAFRKHPKIGPKDGSLTPEELSALVEFARPLHLDLLGNQQSFGHFGQILRHPEYAALREVPDVLTPVKPETYQLLDDLYAEVCPLLPFPWFNVCCDETWGLGTGPSRELAAKIGEGGVYVQHILKVRELLQRRQKRMMMWGDIILQHPDHLKNIPKDVIMLTWGYDPRPSFEDQIVPFARSGYEFFVCPGVNNWSRILPDFGAALTNIQHFVRDGVKHGALGMLNTDWEDDGEAINAVKWHADAWAAECAWNASQTPPDLFNRRAGAVLFGEKGGRFGQAIELLARTHRMRGMQGMLNSRFWAEDFMPRSSPETLRASASNLLAAVRPAIVHLSACRQEAVANQAVLDAILFGARRMERIGQRMLDGLEAAQLYERAAEQAGGPGSAEAGALLQRVETLVRANREAHAALGADFAALWRSESKPYALDWTLKRYTNKVASFDRLLGKIRLARTDCAAGKRIPQPEEVGLALPSVQVRNPRPREVVAAPLAPEAPWIVPEATHRLGVRIAAGPRDRSDTPIELELALPSSLVGKSAAVAVLGGDPALRAPAQVDAGVSSNKARLVFLLPGRLAANTETAAHVYLGLPDTVPPLSQACSVKEGSKGMKWIENDKVRLLLGPEGGHVYRWEAKAAGGRDLTQPGEGGWAGFCDIGALRSAPYTLNCLARGPALVRFACAEPSGHTKTISLFSGCSWIEVLLSEPSPVFWNFDNPRNFAADGPSPGTYLFSDGRTGKVGREADGVPAQVKASNTRWSVKFNPDGLALGMATPGTAAFHHVAPGAAAGGVGIESSPPASHFIVFAGRLEQEAAQTMSRLEQSLDLKSQPQAILHALQAKPPQR